MGRTMYDISKELDIARDNAFLYAEEHDGELPDYINTYLDSLEGEFEDKAVNIACVIKELSNFSDDIVKERRRLAKLKETTDNEIERIKYYLSQFVGEGVKIKTPSASISWRKSTSVVLNKGIKAEDLPEEYQKVKIEESKSALKKALSSGDDVSKFVSKFAKLTTVNRIQVK